METSDLICEFDEILYTGNINQYYTIGIQLQINVTVIVQLDIVLIFIVSLLLLGLYKQFLHNYIMFLDFVNRHTFMDRNKSHIFCFYVYGEGEKSENIMLCDHP